MAPDDAEFRRLIEMALRRFCAQNGVQAPADPELSAIGDRLRRVIRECGLPRALGAGELGQPGGMPADECTRLAALVAGDTASALVVDAVRQLVKACFHPEFRNCRNSFRETAPDGSCRRQELERARHRISGAHCVDCPHWVALTPAQHEQYLAAEWRAGAAAFTAHRDIFLPEDFRAIRQWLYRAARSAGTNLRVGD